MNSSANSSGNASGRRCVPDESNGKLPAIAVDATLLLGPALCSIAAFLILKYKMPSVLDHSRICMTFYTFCHAVSALLFDVYLYSIIQVSFYSIEIAWFKYVCNCSAGWFYIFLPRRTFHPVPFVKQTSKCKLWSVPLLLLSLTVLILTIFCWVRPLFVCPAWGWDPRNLPILFSGMILSFYSLVASYYMLKAAGADKHFVDDENAHVLDDKWSHVDYFFRKYVLNQHFATFPEIELLSLL